MRNEGEALHCQMVLALEKFKEHSPQFIHTIFLHGLLPPGYCLFLLSLNFFPQTTPKKAAAPRIRNFPAVSIKAANNAVIDSSFSGCLSDSDACALINGTLIYDIS